jgi:DegV family protein with EDD domain
MALRIVTDSVSDIPARLARELGITVVPLVFGFGEESFRDGVDMDADAFYAKLARSPQVPRTSTPTPAAFTAAFDRLSEDGSEVLAITLSSRLSGTYNAALQGRSLAARPAMVEVMDSGWAANGEGFIVMAAARAAAAGASRAEAAEAAREAAGRVDFLAAFDTLEYLRRGGRIGAAAVFLGSLLKINPLISLRDGVVHPVGMTRSRAKAIDALVAFVGGYAEIDELAVGHAACAEEAAVLLERVAALVPGRQVLQTRLTPVMGAHTGPGLIIAAVKGRKR